MQLVRNAIVIVVLIGVGYAVYTYVNKPEQTPPPGIDTEIPQSAVEDGSFVQMGTEMSVPDAVPSLPKSAPKAFPADPNSDAPKFGSNDAPAAPAFKGSDSLAPPASSSPASATPEKFANVESAAPPISAPPAATGKFSDAWSEAQSLLSQERLVDAHALLSAWYGSPDLTPQEERQLVDLLGQLAGTIIYSNTTHLLEQPHIVRDNETLKTIADNYAVPPRLLAKINGIDEQQPLRPGEKLKVVRGPFDAVLDLQRKEVSLQLRGQYAGRFSVVRTGLTPEQFKGGPVDLQVKEKMNAGGEHYVGLERNLGIYAEDYSENALKMPAEASIVLSARDAEDVYDILTYQSKVAVAP
jgi:hypothetical protein